jgi:GDPmannose 4,6-dehydratase
VTDQGSVNRAFITAMPDEVYNLAAQSFVGGSWDCPVSTSDITGLGALRILEAIRQFNPKAKYYQASSSEMFGNQSGSLNESSLLAPRSPYGCAKVFAHNATVNYRESFGLHASCGILFNHESPRRGQEFVTQKIIQAGKAGQTVKLGNVDARRDWGYAKEYVEAMWLMLQQDEPDDYVISTGEQHSISELLDIAFNYVGIKDWIPLVLSDPRYTRPAELHSLCGDSSKAKKILNWSPKTSFQQMIETMVQSDIDRLSGVQKW